MSDNEPPWDSTLLYTVLVEATPDAILVTGPNGGPFRFANGAACALLGYEREELLALTTDDVVFHEDAERLGQALATVQAHGTWSGEWRFRCKDDALAVTDAALALVVLGTQVVCLGAFRDATAHQDSIRDTLLRVQMLAALPEAVIGTDVNGSVSYWNDAATRLYGWEADEAIGRNVVELLAAQRASPSISQISAALNQGLEWRGELLMRHRNDGTFTAQVSTGPVRDERQRLTGFVVLSSDLSARERAENRRAAQEQQEAVREAARAAFLEVNRSLAPLIACADLLALNAAALNNPSLSRDATRVADAAAELAARVRSLQARQD